MNNLKDLCKFLSLPLIIFLISCNLKQEKNSLSENERKDNPAKEERITGDIVIILENIPENWKYSMKSGGYSHNGKHEIEYSIDGIIPIYYFPNYSKGIDTLVIENVNKTIEIRHKYNGLDMLSFLANPLDTLIFSYNNKTPTIRNLKNNNIKYGYEYLIRQNVNKGLMPSYVKYNLPFIFLQEDSRLPPDVASFKKALQKFKNKYFQIAKTELEKEKLILDSLRINNALSKPFYDFYDLKVKYKLKILNIKQNELASFKDYEQVDSLLKYSFYRDYLNAISENGIAKKVKIKKSKNYSIPNPEAMYDSITSNFYLSKEAKKYLSFQSLENIMNTSSNKKSDSYFKLFRSQYKNDTLLIKYLIEKYKLDASFSNDLILKDEHGRKTTFQQVLDKNRGKIIYLDFWASWCAPCRAVMPMAHSLRKKFKNKDVVFIYLALNDNQKKWEEAIIKEELVNYEDSYIITNSKTSSMIDDLDVQSIPRYIIYDKKQKIVYRNAPAPNDSDTEAILNKLLLEE